MTLADIRGVINIAESRGDDELVENRRQAQHDEQREARFNVESRIRSMLKSGYADSR
jgi:hypothetical protein